MGTILKNILAGGIPGLAILGTCVAGDVINRGMTVAESLALPSMGEFSESIYSGPALAAGVGILLYNLISGTPCDSSGRMEL
ncbi:hypothetical protein HOA55_03280 [archaeon]|nr:hypothetical protein [archaeon]MBT3577405.1 hypothetical protein [archaeon]MBT6820352.1 hypothetical protein [archaeon]MBT6956097.1 hypothetical protein [archaeon]MBT7025166.1 hypothetical protein [archaeon]